MTSNDHLFVILYYINILIWICGLYIEDWNLLVFAVGFVAGDRANERKSDQVRALSGLFVIGVLGELQIDNVLQKDQLVTEMRIDKSVFVSGTRLIGQKMSEAFQ